MYITGISDWELKRKLTIHFLYIKKEEEEEKNTQKNVLYPFKTSPLHIPIVIKYFVIMTHIYSKKTRGYYKNKQCEMEC